jgi:hypothetical protein
MRINQYDETLAFAANQMSQRKEQIISALVANRRCPFTTNELRAKPLAEVEKIAQLGGITVNERLECYDGPKIILS